MNANELKIQCFHESVLAKATDTTEYNQKVKDLSDQWTMQPHATGSANLRSFGPRPYKAVGRPLIVLDATRGWTGRLCDLDQFFPMRSMDQP